MEGDSGTVCHMVIKSAQQ